MHLETPAATEQVILILIAAAISKYQVHMLNPELLELSHSALVLLTVLCMLSQHIVK